VMAPNIFQSEAAELLLVLLPLKAFFDKNWLNFSGFF
jgi:hypothetical protein